MALSTQQKEITGRDADCLMTVSTYLQVIGLGREPETSLLSLGVWSCRVPSMDANQVPPTVPHTVDSGLTIGWKQVPGYFHI